MSIDWAERVREWEESAAWHREQESYHRAEAAKCDRRAEFCRQAQRESAALTVTQPTNGGLAE